ncbi:MAG: hypothetical protein N2644_09295 [Candidatus Sumerlaea chitinivorans]|nr:hypothetical protein [Candidatus Sumerlaea chitinivorans]
MDDKMAKYMKLVKSNVERIVIVLMYALVGVLVYFWWGEQNPSEATIGEEGKPAVFKDPIAENPHYKLLAEFKKPRDITAYPEIDQVARFNMFEYKSVKQREAIEREANEKYRRAEEAANGGRTEEAKRLLKEILDAFPTHQKARELMNKLTGAATQAGAGATTAPAAAK